MTINNNQPELLLIFEKDNHRYECFGHLSYPEESLTFDWGGVAYILEDGKKVEDQRFDQVVKRLRGIS